MLWTGHALLGGLLPILFVTVAFFATGAFGLNAIDEFHDGAHQR
jgi:hypothetical protein